MTIKIRKGSVWRCEKKADAHSVTMTITFPVKKTTRPEYGDLAGEKSCEDKIRIIDFEKETEKEFPLLPAYKMGDVYNICIDFGKKDPAAYGYQLIRDGVITADPEAIAVRRRGEETINLFDLPKESQDLDEAFMPTSLRDMCLYKLHVKGFTCHPSSGVKAPGTFEGVIEKLPYIKSLGMNAIELMPVYDFRKTEKKMSSKTPRINYWGYGPAGFMAVHPEYAKDQAHTEASFKHLVKELHKAGITVIMEMMFTEDETMAYQIKCLRHWRYTYQVDGFHVSAWHTNMREVLADPYLADTIIIAENFDGSHDRSTGIRRVIAHDGFMEMGRAFLRGDINSGRAFMDSFVTTWVEQGKVNYMAGYNGMTLSDMVTYEKKHNEDNGEDNLDGTDRNFSCNYGHEGVDCSLGTAILRSRQIKNAMAMTLLSEGIPMLMMGDECGRTQRGNNNAWCQDNEISWFDWEKVKENEDLLSFVRQLMQLRQESKALHAAQVPLYTDKSGSGFPDLSMHGIEPWFTDQIDQLGVFGLMYAKDNEIIYVAFNMGVLDIEMSLPSVGGRKWQAVISTEDELPKTSEDGRSFSMMTKSITILKAVG